ncbi:hypothetical protein B0J12DRAFT_677658 [Macrophomina phaseolina]|uniref:Uncharacterized protein n=1 Tax=Macrophomina phaseolina TaxID=35725 RepID=A0ABQ8FZM2_9PEZI|nr:hypothetical protein B0J12DRAFT_677658 [Macrophomina phaseolina]
MLRTKRGGRMGIAIISLASIDWAFWCLDVRVACTVLYFWGTIDWLVLRFKAWFIFSAPLRVIAFFFSVRTRCSRCHDAVVCVQVVYKCVFLETSLLLVIMRLLRD